MPTKAPVHVPVHARDKKKVKRKTSCQRGYGYAWQQKRKAYFLKAENVMCKICAHEIATDLDHVVPHKGNKKLFDDPDNLQGLCKECHAIKTATEDGGFGREMIVNWHPEWLKPSLIPLTIVCGASGSGRRDFVEHIDQYDNMYRIDVDVILSRIIDQAGSGNRKDYLKVAGRRRNQMIGNLSKPDFVFKYDSAYLILSEPRRLWRQWWDDTLHPKDVCVIETPVESCVNRINQKKRDDDKCQAARKWWSDYERREGDRVVENMW